MMTKNELPKNWHESKTISLKRPARRSRPAAQIEQHVPAQWERDAAIALVADKIRTLGRKLEIDDVIGDSDCDLAANVYLDDYADDTHSGKRHFFDFLDQMIDARQKFGSLTDGQVKGVLNCLRADIVRQDENDRRAAEQAARPAPVAQPTRREPVTSDGMYKLADGTIYKVQIAVNGSGNLYAKKLVVHDDEWSSSHGITPAHVSFEYEPGAIRRLSASDKMTLEEAKAFGTLYGTCCVCGRTLTDETSIAEGIGPICAGKGFWS